MTIENSGIPRWVQRMELHAASGGGAFVETHEGDRSLWVGPDEVVLVELIDGKRSLTELSELPCTNPVALVDEVTGKLAQELQIDAGRLIRSAQPMTLAEHAETIMKRSFPHHTAPQTKKSRQRTTPDTRLKAWLRDCNFDDLVQRHSVEVQIKQVSVNKEFQSFQNGVMHHLSAPSSFKWESLLGELFTLNQFGAALQDAGSDAQLHLVTAASGSNTKGQTVDALRGLAGPSVDVIDFDDSDNTERLRELLEQARSHH